MLLEGKHTCQRCNTEFEWYYQVPQRIHQLTANILPKNKVAVGETRRNEDGMPMTVQGYCPVDECGYRNTFDVDYKSIVITP